MKIRELAEKLQKGNISSNELNDLNFLVSKAKSMSLNEAFDEEWNMASGVATGTKPDKLIRKIQKAINETEKTKRSRYGLINKSDVLLKSILQYAAVLAVGVISSWLVFNLVYDIRQHEESSGFQIVEVQNGSKSKIHLQDGTIVHLNSGSRLYYPTASASDQRYVRLVGEAFFDVSEDRGKPFYVYTEDMTVKALGTKFNVKAYPDEKTSETTLIEGKVEVYSNLAKFEPDNKPLTSLSPNQKCIIGRIVQQETELIDDAKVEIQQPALKLPEIIKNVHPEVDIEWRNNILILDNEPFSSIVNKLERWYGVHIKNPLTRLDTMRFSGKFDRESITDVLSALSQIEPFAFDIRKDEIVLKPKIKSINQPINQSPDQPIDQSTNQ